LEEDWSVTTRTRQHPFRAPIADMVADVDETTREVILKIHWQGG
jgi:hypothetical protein